MSVDVGGLVRAWKLHVGEVISNKDGGRLVSFGFCVWPGFLGLQTSLIPSGSVFAISFDILGSKNGSIVSVN